MVIRKFVHSKRTNDNVQLFSLIGEYCASSAVRSALGCAISSSPGQVWYVAVEGDTVHAFASVRVQKGKGLLRHLHAIVDDNGIWEMVLQHCIEHARQKHARQVRLIDYISMEDRYARAGFVPQGPPRGRFVQYLLTLEYRHGG